ncbi:hypothetical protein [Niveispirillum sp. KHB5.9]|uniref:hypothetical protein n=1 Tax=Niveispirillum sp. KHB5.9 TaxID=3400269 RepID=UPI003A875E25
MPIKFDLGEYLTDIFIETGIGDGGNIIKAMRAGFADIHGIDASPVLHAAANERVAHEMGRLPWRTNVMLYCGDPVAGLHQVCGTAHHKRATILLDSRDGGDGAPRPLFDEIRVLRHWFGDGLILPVIMVGGIRQAPGQASPPPLGPVIDALLDLCDEYQFRILADDTSRNILAALPPTLPRTR